MDDGEGMGARFWLVLLGGVAAVGIGAFVVFLVIGAAWYAWGGVGVFALFALILLAFGVIYDRRHPKRAFEDPEGDERLREERQAQTISRIDGR